MHPYPLEHTPQFRGSGGMITHPEPPETAFPQYNSIRSGYGVDREHQLANQQSAWVKDLGKRVNAGASVNVPLLL